MNLRMSKLLLLAFALAPALAALAQSEGDRLLEAARNGDAAAIRSLLDRGAPVDVTDAKGRTPLMQAAGRGHLETVKLLLAHGADPNTPAANGSTSLSFARAREHHEIAHLLQEAGARQ